MEEIKNKENKIDEGDNLHLNFYYCEKCKSIPKLQLRMEDNLFIEIRCDYCPKGIRKMSLSSFIEEINKRRTNQFCYNKNAHGEVISETYCANCEKWLCLECMKKHIREYIDHLLLSSDGLKMKINCDTQGCKKEAELYCVHCHRHICNRCKENKHNEHPYEVRDLKFLLSQEEIQKLEMDIKNLPIILDNQNKEYKEYISLCEQSLSNLKMFYEEKEKSDKDLVHYFQSLLESYNKTKHIPYYHTRNNLQINSLNNIIALRNKSINQKIKTITNDLDYGTNEIKVEEEVKPPEPQEEQFWYCTCGFENAMENILGSDDSEEKTSVEIVEDFDYEKEYFKIRKNKSFSI